MTRPPNILLIQADQHRYDCLGASGHPLLRTPALDRLAAEGVRFARAYCPIPVCVPARNSLITGAWPSRHGVIANWGTEVAFPTQQALPTYTQALQDNGYWLAHVGKWQVHPKRGPEAYGFAQHARSREYAVWRAARGLPPRPHQGGWDQPWHNGGGAGGGHRHRPGAGRRRRGQGRARPPPPAAVKVSQGKRLALAHLIFNVVTAGVARLAARRWSGAPDDPGFA